jgi:hypothetical protein
MATASSTTGVFFMTVAIGFVLLVVRNPTSLLVPNFYAEDGSTYTIPLLSKPILQVLREAKPDYCVLGNVFFAQVAVWIWKAFSTQDLDSLAKINSLVAFAAYAFMFGFSVIAVWGQWRSVVSILFLVTVFFVPLDMTDWEILGRMCNVGFPMVYTAFLCVVARERMLSSPWKCAGVDAVTWFCVATNPLSFLALPFHSIPYVRCWLRQGWKEFPSRSFGSLVALVVASLPLVAWIVLAPKVPYGEPTGMDIHRYVELVFARSLLYPLVHPVYSLLSTHVTAAIVACLAVFVGLTWQRNRSLATIAALSFIVGAATYYFLKRPWLVQHTQSYTVLTTSRYYFALNLIALFLVFQCFDSLLKLARGQIQSAVAYLLMAGFFAYTMSDVGRQSHFGKPHDDVVGRGSFKHCVRTAMHANRRGADETAQAPVLRVRTTPMGWPELLPVPLSVVGRDKGVATTIRVAGEGGAARR